MQKIAVIGLSCLFPGASSPDVFWDNLVSNKDSRCLAGAAQMGVSPEDYFSPEKGAQDKYYCLKGGYVRDFSFGADNFSVAPEQLKGLDRVFLWSLHVAREALKDAGYLGADATFRTGVVLGNLSFPTMASNQMFIPIYEHAICSAIKKITGFSGFSPDIFRQGLESPFENTMISGFPAALICQALDLMGPRLALDAACASSLYSVRLACDYLNSGRADMMLAGAVSAADPFFVNMGFSIFQAHPQGGDSRPLDKSSGGLVAGEGAGMFVLKRYKDALSDKDKIYALIRGAGLSNDGKGASVLSPNPKGQALAFERAYKDAQTDPKEIKYIECHATGTPLGDRIELDSMGLFFGKHNARPMIGSVKSNLGHLLTAAGMAGMTKVILAMAKGEIPGTINLNNPADSANEIFEDKIPASTTDWPETIKKRCAGVSAFGFGGTNAHLIFENDFYPELSVKDTEKYLKKLPVKGADKFQNMENLAIVGMDAHFGPCNDLDEFFQTIYKGARQFIELPEKRWKGLDKQKDLLKQFGFKDGKAPKGAYIRDFDLDFLRFKIPPNPDDQLISQQMLAMKVADNAILKANISYGSNVAVLVAMETELALHQFRGRVNLQTRLPEIFSKAGMALSEDERSKFVEICKDAVHNAAKVNQYTSFIGNIMASRISSLWDFSGPAFTVSSQENSVFRAIEIGAMLLEKNEVDAVVVGAVDLAGGMEKVLWQNKEQPFNVGRPGFLFDKNVNGPMVGEGAGAVVLKRADIARKDKNQIYCIIKSLAFEPGIDEKSVEKVSSIALVNASIISDKIAYIEACASGFLNQDKAELNGLANAYKGEGEKPSCAIGSVKSNIGHLFAASQMASLIKTALSLYHGFIPGSANWAGPKDDDKNTWEKSPFYVPSRSQTWFGEPERLQKIAAISGLGKDGVCSHMILSEEPRQTKPKTLWSKFGPYVFPFTGDSPAHLEKAMDILIKDLEAGILPAKCVGLCFSRIEKKSRYALAIVGDNKDRLLAEIDAARVGIASAISTGDEWNSLAGSCFSPNPQGPKGKVAFVYPGGFNSYPQMGRDVFQLFPQIYEKTLLPKERLGDLICEKLLYPRGLDRVSQKDMALYKNPVSMFESGIMFAIARTDIVRDCFNIKPDMALGYSMGEISMMYGLGVWDRTPKMSDILRKSPVFRSRLAGSMDAVRDAWNLPGPKHADEKIWHSFALKAPAASIQKIFESKYSNASFKNGPRAYLIFINTLNEVVIAGDEKACMQVIKKAGCEYFDVPMGDAIHCDIVRADFDELARLHTLDINQVHDIKFYTAVSSKPLNLDSKGIAENIAEMYCSHIDFAALVQTAYKDGARVFVELGPRENCTNWIKEILGDKEFAAVATDRKGADCKTSFIRALAKLYAHQVPMDILSILSVSKIDESASEKSASAPLKTGKKLIQTITLGGDDIEAAILSRAGQIGKQKKPNKPEPKKMPPIPKQEIFEPEILKSTPVQPISEINQYDKNLDLASQGHAAFLRNRNQALGQIQELISAQARIIADSPDMIEVKQVENPTPLPEIEKKPALVWDRAALEEFAKGKIANVFGPEYKVIDDYKRRVRLPMDPYLLVSRVTKLDAKRGEFKPSTMTTEYDIDKDAWFLVDGQIPWAVSVESGQCDLLLISFLGIDFECRSFRVYRLLDCTLTFLDDLAKAGQTLSYDISINSFARSGGSLLFFFSYECFVDNRMVLKMDGGCAGFFSDDELAAGKGIIRTEEEIQERAKIEKQNFIPLLNCEKFEFNKEDLLEIIKGRPSGCFGPDYDQAGANFSLRFAASQMLMIDRVESLDPKGGAWGLGKIVAHKDLAPDHWYFPCHFKDDEVMAGSLMAEGCVQLLQFFSLFLGLQTKTRDARFQPIIDLPQQVRCRGQVTPKDTLLTYKMEIKRIGLTPEPHIVADVDILLKDKVVVDFKDLGVRLAEKKSGKQAIAEPAPKAPLFTKSHLVENKSAAQTLHDPTPKTPLFTQSHLENFATGSLSRCFGTAYDIYEDRQPPRTPNGDLQLISRVLEVSGKPGDFKSQASVVAEYDVPEDAWFCSANSWPAIMPYSMFMEIALQPCGFISTYMQTTLIMPEKDLFFRNLDGQGILYSRPDLRGKTITNKSVLVSTAKAGGAIIQNFRFELSTDNELFYKGTAVFGYFLKHALSGQIGLDNGINNQPLHTREYFSEKMVEADLSKFQGSERQPYYRLSGPQLNFLDHIMIARNSGKYEKGYIYADKIVDPADWFYPCHFHNDPVMPGSLGVEAILQAIQVFAMHQGIGADMASPYFTQMIDCIIWKYRGQIIPANKQMSLEVHIKEISENNKAITIKGDASLWKNNIRIYEVTDVGLCILDAS